MEMLVHLKMQFIQFVRSIAGFGVYFIIALTFLATEHFNVTIFTYYMNIGEGILRQNYW